MTSHGPNGLQSADVPGTGQAPLVHPGGRSPRVAALLLRPFFVQKGQSSNAASPIENGMWLGIPAFAAHGLQDLASGTSSSMAWTSPRTAPGQPWLRPQRWDCSGSDVSGLDPVVLEALWPVEPAHHQSINAEAPSPP